MGIIITDLVKKYGEQVALDKVSFSINNGEVVGLLGPNGAGKSTLMKSITNAINADSGEISVNDFNVSTQPIESKKLIGFLQENKDQSWQRIDMKAIYYDTEDNFYQKHKIAYRVRCENDCIVATYKSGKVNSDGLFERVEINKKVTKLTPDINVFAEDKDIWSLIKTTKDKKFLPIVITDFVRECIELTWLDSKLEVALDLGFVQVRENKAPICEVEIELKQGKIEDLLSLKDELIKKFGLQISAISKYKKGLILAGQI